MIQEYSQSIGQAQQVIYSFFLDSVRQSEPTRVLQEFRNLFIYYADVSDPSVINALSNIIAEFDEKEFQYTLQRCCYILVNNWSVNNCHHYIQELIEVFTDSYIEQRTQVLKLKILKTWIKNFVQSEAYQTLKLYLGKQGEISKSHWQSRFGAYLLTAQCADTRNPIEQRQLANAYSKKLKHQFKFELAMYTARINSPASAPKTQANPTKLGPEILHLVRIILNRKGKLNYRHLANVFLKTIEHDQFITFKEKLLFYLEFNEDDRDIINIFETELVDKVDDFFNKYDDSHVTSGLIQATCNLVIDCLTFNYKNQQPSRLFHALLQQGNPLFMVILLLRIILICEGSRSHLEICIARLIKYYSEYQEDECRAFIHFLDILNVTLAIYAQDTTYNLVKMNKEEERNNFSSTSLNDYRIFSQTSKLEH